MVCVQRSAARLRGLLLRLTLSQGGARQRGTLGFILPARLRGLKSCVRESRSTSVAGPVFFLRGLKSCECPGQDKT